MQRPQRFLAALALTGAAVACACSHAEAPPDASQTAARVRAAAAEAGDRVADGWLTAKVQARFFADDEIKARYIDVATRDAVVTLKGFVTSEGQRQHAVAIARATDGVAQVRDELLIGQRPRTEIGATEPVGTSGVYAPPATGLDVDDETVTRVVQARFFTNPHVKGRHIAVQTTRGVVTLRGVVSSEEERAQALLLARTTHGVVRVEDHLSIDVSLSPTPE